MIANLSKVSMYIEIKNCDSENTPIVFIHGNGSSHKDFYHIAQKLKNNPLYLCDTRCHGKSKCYNSVDERLHYDDICEDYFEFIKTKIGKKVKIIGHSDGGIIALLMCVNHPEVVEECFVLGANTNPKGLILPFVLVTKINYLFTKNDKLLLMLNEPNITLEQLKKIDVPVHIFAGQFDLIKRKDTMFIHSSIKNSTIKIFKGENHSSYLYNDKLLPFIT